jgi:hypothetical protein
VKPEDENQLRITERKLHELEHLYDQRQKEPVENKTTHELTLQSLKRAMNKLKEEIARYRAAKTTA